ncbi:nucleoid-structuring protein H-NS [Pseudomonas fluorescens]|nr:nucleoid-structuring protein H-NS [Pseudomonas fluorescens]
MPHHSAPRLGSVCPNEGIAPWARREGPSMALRGYPGIHAGMPTPQCLRSAIVVKGAPRSKAEARRPDSRPGSPGRTALRSV